MPKISTNNVKINYQGGFKHYDIVINYNQDNGFYSVIPVEFSEVTRVLSDEELTALQITYDNSKRKRYLNAIATNRTCVVKAATEGDCIRLATKVIEQLLTKAIVKTDVIILHYNSRDLCQYGDMQYNDDHQQIGLRMGITYAQESTIGDSKQYAICRERKHYPGEKSYTNIRLYGKDCAIIPDTPENREALEYLYSALKTLNEKLAGFTKTPEALLGFINSNIKLLQQ